MPAFGAFPGSDPDESPRLNTPNDPRFDHCEPDDEDGTQDCTSYFNEDYRLFGFRPQSANTDPLGLVPTSYVDCSQLDAQGRAANVAAGDPECSMIGGIRADTAWKYSTGSSGVTIAIFDNGIRWQEEELVEKIALNTGELPLPQGSDVYDANGDGRISVSDWQGHPGVTADAGHDEADHILDASDLIAVFSDGTDADGNGYVDDIAGWDFFNDDNDPFDQSDCCQSGHGTGRAEEAAAETDNDQGSPGICPECMVMPLRTSDSIVHDTNLIALATVYAADNGVEVTECSCGGLSNSSFSRRAFEYADAKGVAQIMVSSDINSANHNYPTNYNEAVYVGGALPDTAPNENCEIPSVLFGVPDQVPGEIPGCAEFIDAIDGLGLPIGPVNTQPPTTSFFRNANLTQYGGKADIVLMGATGSENTGQASGAAGLLASYGRERFEGSEFPESLTGNEIRQLLTMTAEDVKPLNTGVIGNADKAQPGWDPHFGYGRVNLAAAMARIQAGQIPPEVQIDAPDWFAPVSVERVGAAGLPVDARISSPHFNGGIEWELAYACGQDAPDSTFEVLATGADADGELGGEIARLPKGLLEELADTCDGSIANDAGLPAGRASDGWPVNTYPEPDPLRHSVQIRLTANESADPDNVGIYRKTIFPYRDDGNHEGWPKAVGPGHDQGRLVTGSGGEASPRLFDLDGDNALDVLLPTTSGELHALDSGGNPLPTWNGGRPVRTGRYAQAASHSGADGIAALDGGPREALRAPAIGDVTGDGKADVVATAGEHIYGWTRTGAPLPGFPQRVDPHLSRQCVDGGPRCFAPADRFLTRERHLKRGFVASPALADLDGDGTLDIVAGALDGHVYAWDGGGELLPGFPVKLDSEGEEDAAEIVASPAIADLDADGDPEVVVATNELLGTTFPDSPDISPFDLLSLFVGGATGTSVTYAIHGDGTHVDGWPVQTGALAGDLLPLVMPSQDAAVGDLVPGSLGDEVSISVGTGFSRLVAGDGSVITGYQSEQASPNVTDTSPVINIADYASIGALNDLQGPSVIKGGLTLLGAANLLAVNQNFPFNHVVQAWDPGSGAYRPGFPLATDDFQLLSQPVIAGVGGDGARQAIVGTGLYQLHAYGADGAQPAGWPKFTGGWIFATPSVGDADGDGKLDVMTLTREGWAFLWATDAPACDADGTATNSEWWTFHHDEHGTANYGHDGRPPGAPEQLGGTVAHGTAQLSWRAPGDDLMCGQAQRFRVVATSGPAATRGAAPRGAAGPEDGQVVLQAEAAAGPGELETRTVPVPQGTTALAVMYRDEAGNWGHAASVPVAGAGPVGQTPGPVGQTPVNPTPAGGKRCLSRKLGVSSKRIGPVRLRMRVARLRERYRSRRVRGGRRFCVRGGGRFVIGVRRGRIDLVISTARRHATRRTAPGRKVRGGRVVGGTRIGPRMFVGYRSGRGRMIYALSKRNRVRYLAVVTKKQTTRPRRLRRRLTRLGF